MNLRRNLLVVCFAVASAVSTAGSAGAQTASASVADQLDQAFETLATSDSERVAKSAERRILRLWMETESDTVDLLMSWALEAMEDEDFALALDFLDRIVVMMPDYVEGWNKRATVHFLLDDYERALADIEQVLLREPRHFGAMSGLGIIFRDIGETDRAIEVFRTALELDPYLENVSEALDKIESERESEL